jgi:hypothetical protein
MAGSADAMAHNSNNTNTAAIHKTDGYGKGIQNGKLRDSETLQFHKVDYLAVAYGMRV